MGVDQYRVCELWAAGPDRKGSGSGYRLGGRLVLTARHVIAPALAGPGGKLLARPVGGVEWLPARVEWHDVDADAALIGSRVSTGGRQAGSRCCAWGNWPVRSGTVRGGRVPVGVGAAGPDAGHRARVRAAGPARAAAAGRLDFDVASASPTAREGGSPWAGMSGAGVIADSHLVGVITVDPARYAGRWSRCRSPAAGRPGFRARLVGHGVRPRRRRSGRAGICGCPVGARCAWARPTGR